jgi:hypothetical protein
MNKPKLTATAVERSLAIRTQLHDIVNKLVRDYYDDKLTLRDLEGAASILNNTGEFSQIANMARHLACHAVQIIEAEEQRTNA